MLQFIVFPVRKRMGFQQIIDLLVAFIFLDWNRQYFTVKTARTQAFNLNNSL